MESFSTLPPPRRGGGGAPLYGPQNGCMGQWSLWVPDENLGGTAGATGAGNFSLASRGGTFFQPHVFMLKILRILWRIQKWVKSAKIISRPTLADGSLR